jgi:DNA polymerase III gamma/tau subunit
MSQPWGVRFRPRTVEEIVGNESVVNKLLADMKAKALSSRLLITGPTGSAKTTLSYILAEYFTGIQYNPDTQSTCVSEINGAVDRGIDTIRETLERVRFAPLIGKRHVVLADEIQEFTPAALKALLKPTESEGETVWILLTDQPERLSTTLRSRFNQIKLTYPTAEELVALAEEVYKEEKIKTFPRKAVEYMAQRAGSVRLFLNALQDLHQSKASDAEAAERALMSALDDGDRDTVSNLLAFLTGDTTEMQAVNIMACYPTWSMLLNAAAARTLGMSGDAAQPNYFTNMFYERFRKFKLKDEDEVLLSAIKKINEARTRVILGGCDGVSSFLQMLL